MSNIKCWSCNQPTTTDRISYNDGFCPYCMAEVCLDEIDHTINYRTTIKNMFLKAVSNIRTTDWKLDSNGAYYCKVSFYISDDDGLDTIKQLDKKELHIIVREIMTIVEDCGYKMPVVVYNRCKDRDGNDVTIKITLVDSTP